jgi:hypothetical protein
MISWLHGVIKVQERLGHRAAVAYLRQVIHRCQKTNFGTDSSSTGCG